jgi:hypothetical protein
MKWMLSIFVAAHALGCQAVEGDRILGKDLASANPIFAALSPDLALGFTPLAGIKRVFPPGELRRIAREHGISTIDPLASLCFERTTERLSVERLQPSLELALERASGQKETHFELLDFARYGVPRGALEFDHSGPGPSGVWRGKVIYAEGRSMPIWVKIRLGSAQLASESLRGVAIERGDQVQVEVRSGGARVTFESKAESTGHLGDLIIVRNPENGKLFRARVEAKGRVSVQT